MKLALSLAALLLATTAQAQVTGTTNSEANANTTSAATNAGNAQSLALISNSPGTIRNVPSIGGSAYGVSYSPKNCNSTVGVQGALPGMGASIATATENEVCEDLLKFDSMQMAATTVHNMGFKEDAAAMRAAAWDLMCLTSAKSLKVLTAHGLCSDITKLVAAAGGQDPEQTRGRYMP